MRSPNQRPGLQTIDIVLLLLVVVFLYLLLFKLPFYPFYYETDTLIFLENADRMVRGEMMYRDFFQFTFPGCQIFYYFLFLIFGPQYWLAGAAAIITGAGSFLVCLLISKRLIEGPFAYLPAITFSFFGLRWFGIDGSHRVFSPLFVWIALLVLIKYPRSYALAGLLCALSSFFTQNRGVAAMAGLGLFILVDNYVDDRSWKRMFAEMSALVLGFFISLTLLCSYFLITAGVNEFLWSTLLYPAGYYQYFEQNNYGVYFANLKRAFSHESTFLEFLPAVFYSTVPLATIAFFLVYFRFRRTEQWSYWRGPMLVACMGVVLVLTTTGPSYLRFFHVSVPALILLYWLFAHFKVFESASKQLTGIAAALLIVSSAIIAVRFQLRTDYVQIDAPRGKVFASPASFTFRYQWLLDHTEPGEHVLEAYPPDVYFLLELRSASRYAQFLPTDYTRPEFVSAAVDDLKQTRPRYILWNNSYIKPEDERSPGDHLGKLADYVTREYVPSGPTYELGGQPMQIWERRSDTDSVR